MRSPDALVRVSLMAGVMYKGEIMLNAEGSDGASVNVESTLNQINLERSA